MATQDLWSLIAWSVKLELVTFLGPLQAGLQLYRFKIDRLFILLYKKCK